MAEQKSDSRYWLYFLLFVILVNSMSQPSRSEVRNIVRTECLRYE